MAKSNWVLHFVRDFEVESFVRIKVFAGSAFAGSIWQRCVDGLWQVNLFEDIDSIHNTDCFDGKAYKNLNGAKIAVSKWINRNWSVNMEGGRGDA